jgi:hypothetical protein
MPKYQGEDRAMSRSYSSKDAEDGEVNPTSPEYLDEVDPADADALPADNPNVAAGGGTQLDHEQQVGEFVKDDDGGPV